MTETRHRAALPGFLLIAIAAAMWGTDGILRAPLTDGLRAGVIVFW